MRLSCYRKIVLLLFNLLQQSQGLQRFHVFWELKSNTSECLREGDVLKNVVNYPYLCYQTKYNNSNPMNIEKCVENIPCRNRTNIINIKEVAHCKTKEEIVCCIEYEQCDDDNWYVNMKNETKCYGRQDTSSRKKGICQFPFIYHGESYYKCTTTGKRNCYRWCATLTDENNVYIPNSGMWGYCNNDCDVNYDETCRKKSKHKKKASRYKEKNNSRQKRKQHQKFPRFKEEHEKEKDNPRPEEIEHQCSTRNTTTFVINRFDGDTKEFTLVNPGKCSFPFNYKGTWYSNCIAEDDPLCRLWCSVKNDHGYHRKKGSKWAYCREVGCNMNKSEEEYTQIGPKCQLEKHGRAENHFFEWELTRIEYVESEDPNFNIYDMEDSVIDDE